MFTTSDIDSFITGLKHKDQVKTTTSLKFKRDLAQMLLRSDFDGDILEIGTGSGFTTLTLGAVGMILNKRVVSVDLNPKFIKHAANMAFSCELQNCYFVWKDAYKESWSDLGKFGFVFIDCVHTIPCVQSDLRNAVKVGAGGFIIIHDYGLFHPEYGDAARYVIKNGPFEIVNYLGEKEKWNPLGSGEVVDWEGARLKYVG